jgi:hypothetical protein
MGIAETSGGRDFRVRPGVLREYAATVRGRGGALADVGGNLAAVAVEPAWFGRLPQSGHLADRYETHHQAELAGIAELMRALLAVAAALEATAAVYSGVDVAAADALQAVRTAGRGVVGARSGGGGVIPGGGATSSPGVNRTQVPAPSPTPRPTPTPTPAPSPTPTPSSATGIAEAIR